MVKAQLDYERKNSRNLKMEKAIYYTKRNELEELFLECIDEVRKEISRRKSITLAKANNLNQSMNKNKSKSSRTKDDSLDAAIKSGDFTAADKRKVIDLLMSNENVLLFLYEKLFPRQVTNDNIIDQVHLTGATQNNFTNLGFRPRTSMPGGEQSRRQPSEMMV